jgi:hypothetical protein
MVGAAIKTPNPPTPPAPKPRTTTSPREPGSSPRRPGTWPPIVRGLVSVLLVWHVSAVFLAAVSVPGPTSPLVLSIAQKPPMQWYLDALYLNQGHSFFAPEVGPGHLIQYECFDQNGQSVERGELPNRKEHWPRLLYHRYFMLAEQAERWSDDKQERDNWQRKYLEAYARHLLYVNKDAQSARVRRFAHWPLPRTYAIPDRKKGYEMLMRDFSRQGENKRIDVQGYEFLGEAIQRRSDVDPEAARQSMNWQNFRANTASRPWGPPR